MTVQQLITSSLRLIGQLGPGRSTGGSELADALLVFNAMLDSWAAERSLIYAVSRGLFALEASTDSYSIGPSGAAWTAARPVYIERAGLMIDAETEAPLRVIYDAEYAGIGQKELASSQPSVVYYRPTAPNGTVIVWPVPTEARDVVLYTWAPLPAAVTAETALALPPGYEDALRYNLAVRLAPEWGKALRGDVVELARDSLMRVKVANTPMTELRLDAALTGARPFDWRIG
jgi:hypothetical protein